MHLLSVDVETTGLDPYDAQLIEVGAVYCHYEQGVVKEEYFHTYIKHSSVYGDLKAIAMNIGILKTAKEMGRSMNDAVAAWHRFVTRPYKLVPVGKNFGSFDRQFLQHNGFDLSNIVHRSVDPGSMLVDLNDKYPPNLQECAHAVGLNKTVTHTALEDAKLTLEIVLKAFEDAH